MKCIECDKEAVVISRGNSLCDDHSEKKEQKPEQGQSMVDKMIYGDKEKR